MAKLINGLLGSSKKKVGNLVTYVLKGQQVARSKAANIANPRTSAQMGQRTKMANLVNFYRANKSWMEKLAYENKKQKWSVWNAFVHANIGQIPVYLTKQEAAAGACVAAPYVITNGSLNTITANEDIESAKYITNLYVGEFTLTDVSTVAELSMALIEHNNGIEAGMQLSLIEVFQEVQDNMPRIVVRKFELIIDQTSTAKVSDYISSAGIETAQNAIAYNPNESGAAQAFAFVLSKTTSNKTFVSSQSLVLVDPGVYQSYSSSTAKNAAIESYGGGDSTPFLDSTNVAGSSSGSVPVALSIVQARLGNSGSWTNPDGYLGAPTLGQTFEVKFNRTIVEELGTIEVDDSDGLTSTMTTKSVNDTIVRFSKEAPIGTVSAIHITLGGVVYDVEFATDDSGITE